VSVVEAVLDICVVLTVGGLLYAVVVLLVGTLRELRNCPLCGCKPDAKYPNENCTDWWCEHHIVRPIR
jgi:hypothetical protein